MSHPSPLSSWNRPHIHHFARLFASVFIRLLLAFTCGWMLGLFFERGYFADLATNPFAGFFVWFIELLHPLVGVAALLTVNRRNKHRIFLALGTGLLFVAGIYACWLPITLQRDAVDNANCAAIHYVHVFCNIQGLNTLILNIILLYSIVLVILGSVITDRTLKHNLKWKKLHQLPANADEKESSQH